MSKDEFLQTLDRRLHIINEKERRDIIDEYRSHIEMKIKEGKSEEEAIEDFGNIDELVNEILDAYKINTSHTSSYDAKFNRFMDEMYDGFKRFVSSFTRLDADDVVRLIFEVLVVLLLLMILKIPFSILSSLGSSLLHDLIGFGVGSTLGFIWRFVIGIAYVAVFVLVLFSVISKRVDRYRNANRRYDGKSVFDDFKDSMHDMSDGLKGKGPKSTYTYHSDHHGPHDTYEYKQDDDHEDISDNEASDEERMCAGDEEKQDFENYEKRTSYTDRKTRYSDHRGDSFGNHVTSFAEVLMKIFYILLMIPFLGIIIGLCCALGVMIVTSFQGITLFGPYMIVIGSLIVTSAFLSALYRVLWRRR